MKYRSDYVTNSSSSSFIIHNRTDRPMTAKDVAYHLIASRILEDAEKEKFTIPPRDSITLECGDHPGGDGVFQAFIHNEFGGWGHGYLYGDGECDVEFLESHH